MLFGIPNFIFSSLLINFTPIFTKIRILIRTSKNYINTLVAAALALFPVMLQSCFTGIESTGKINLSKKDLTIVAPSEEDKYLEDITPLALGKWREGKRFIVTDDKFRFAIEGTGNFIVKQGDVIEYEGVESRSSAGGGERVALIFSLDGNNFYFPMEKPLQQARQEITSAQIPMLIDLDMVEQVKAKLLNKNLWIKTALWLDDSLNYKKGRKFIDIRITEVMPGNAFFPLLVRFTDMQGNGGQLLMNLGSSGNESRNFGRLFFLTDPRNNYRQITEENWKAIQGEELRLGMTKEECRLSKGNPQDIDSGHTYSNAMEIWYYPDGLSLSFVDGLLVAYK